MKLEFYKHPLIYRTVSAVVSLLLITIVLTDKTLNKPLRFSMLLVLSGIGWVNARQLEIEQKQDFIALKKQNKADLLDQAVISVPDKEEKIEHPTVFATQHQDPTGLAVAIQTILDSIGTRTTYRGYVNAPRFQRFLLGLNLDSKSLPYDRIAKQLHLNLAAFRVELEDAPIISTNKGLMAIDLPKAEFTPITYAKSSDLIIGARNSNKRIIGLDFNSELITEDINEFNAFCTVGGMTRSGKSAWIRQDCLEFMLRNPNDKFYLIEFKEGTFGLFEGCSQVVDSVAYDIESAASLINKLHEVLINRIEETRGLSIQARQEKIKEFFNNIHHLYFDEYFDDESYTSILANEIFKKGAQYGIRATLATQMHNRSKSSSDRTMSGALLEQSATKLCFRVQTAIASTQIIQSPVGTNLLGFGDCMYKTINKFTIDRLQTIFYTNDELVELCSKLDYTQKPQTVNTIQPTKTVSYQDLTSLYIKPVTDKWRILELVRDSKKKLSPTVIARELGLTRKMDLVNESLELFYTNKLIHRDKAPNGKGFVYYR